MPLEQLGGEDRLIGFNRTSGLTQSWNISAVGDWDNSSIDVTYKFDAMGRRVLRDG